MPWVAFEPTISAGERPKTYALDRAVTGTGVFLVSCIEILNGLWSGPPLLHKGVNVLIGTVVVPFQSPYTTI